jgi:hypothetical protein
MSLGDIYIHRRARKLLCGTIRGQNCGSTMMRNVEAVPWKLGLRVMVTTFGGFS